MQPETAFLISLLALARSTGHTSSDLYNLARGIVTVHYALDSQADKRLISNKAFSLLRIEHETWYYENCTSEAEIAKHLASFDSLIDPEPTEHPASLDFE